MVFVHRVYIPGEPAVRSFYEYDTFMGLLYEKTPSCGIRMSVRDDVPADRSGNELGADG